MLKGLAIQCVCHAKCNYSPTGFPSVITSTDEPLHTHTCFLHFLTLPLKHAVKKCSLALKRKIVVQKQECVTCCTYAVLFWVERLLYNQRTFEYQNLHLWSPSSLSY